MKTPIAEDLRDHRGLLAAYAIVAIGVVSLHLWSACGGLGHWMDWGGTLAALTLLVFVLPGPVSRQSLGLRLTPIQPARYWFRVALVAGAAILVLCVAVTGVAALLGQELPVQKTPPRQVPMHFFHACLVAPLVEELLYRFAICVPAAAILGPRSAIVLSGIVFAGLHFLYGNPGPDNFVAGYILAWAYLKSGSLVVPMALHALGNSVAVAVHALSWFIV